MIIDVLQNIQEELKAPKNQFNKFGNYKYRNCEDILEALKPLLARHKAALIINDKVVQIGDRFYIEATATLYAGDESQSATSYAREEDSRKGMDAPQLTGSSSSYARKYALNGLFAIDDTKDSDALPPAEDKTQTKQAPPAPPIVPPAPPAPPTCKVCGKVIEGFTNNSGKVYTAEQAATRLKGHCLECYHAMINKA